eukprot:TRINITY_DN39938_c0_g1_i1.p1 TRINITY_DN39938_c0_g1~~TRINITY_DN39938_c0_g1_i1.p1  ORF type:complete len:206 (+),score=42.77 TRINITY_DN39938_c0_g1_i1:64-681(+)
MCSISCCCCACCATLVAIVGGLVVLAHNVGIPKVGVSSIHVPSLDLKSEGPIPIDISATFWVYNPNWLFHGTILEAKATVYSLDKDDSSAPAIPLGKAGLGGDKEVNMDANTNTTFTVFFKGTVSTNVTKERLVRDCTEVNGKTKIGVKIDQVHVSLMGHDFGNLSFGKEIAATVPCPPKPKVQGQLDVEAVEEVARSEEAYLTV